MTYAMPPGQERRIASMLLLILLAAVLSGALTGCSPARTITRTVEVTLPAPPPTVITAPAETLFVELPAPPPRQSARPPSAAPTEPARVIVYRTARPDSLAWAMTSLTADTDSLWLRGTRADLAFRSPAFGETLTIHSDGAGGLRADILGAPRERSARAVTPVPVIVREYPAWRVIALVFGIALALLGASGIIRSITGR